MTDMIGCRVEITRCLTAKPAISDKPGWGYILQETLDKADRTQFEPCHAVGLVGSFYDYNIYAVSFFSHDPFLFDDMPEVTMLFVHENDMRETDDPLIFPNVKSHIGIPSVTRICDD